MRKEMEAMTQREQKQGAVPKPKRGPSPPVHDRPPAPLEGPTRGPRVQYGFVWWPPVDIQETDDAYVFTSELAGLDREDVTIDLMGNELAISGEVKQETSADVAGEEQSTGAPFAYSILLPTAVEADAVDASLENGVLKLTVSKPAPSQRRRIELR
jgi:HSP20 family protein